MQRSVLCTPTAYSISDFSATHYLNYANISGSTATVIQPLYIFSCTLKTTEYLLLEYLHQPDNFGKLHRNVYFSNSNGKHA